MEKQFGSSYGITIDVAIKTLEANELVYKLAGDILGADATKLGVEALKRVCSRREHLSWKFEPLLPGETEKEREMEANLQEEINRLPVVLKANIYEPKLEVAIETAYKAGYKRALEGAVTEGGYESVKKQGMQEITDWILDHSIITHGRNPSTITLDVADWQTEKRKLGIK